MVSPKVFTLSVACQKKDPIRPRRLSLRGGGGAPIIEAFHLEAEL